jgi:multiple sugar transport system substrate-binding protein
MSKSHLSRRDFLKAAAAAGGSTVLLGAAPAITRMVAGAQDQVELSIGHHWEAAFQEVQTEWDAAFLERHPDIILNNIYNTWQGHNDIVPTWAAAGTLPDIVYVHGSRTSPWTSEGILGSVQSYVDEDAEFNVEGIWEESLRLYRVDGELRAIPYDHGPLILGYNKDIFDAAGMDYPGEDWTMEDMVEAATALTDASAQQWGFGGSLPNLNNGGMGATLRPWGAKLLNEDETELLLDNDEARAALNFWTGLIIDQHIAPTFAEAGAFGDPLGTGNIVFRSGRAAMELIASWDTPSLEAQSPFEWDVAPWPEGPAGRGTGSFGSGFGTTATSQHPDEAWTYLSEYLSVEGMIFMWGSTGRGSPARADAYQSWLDSGFAPAGAQYFLDALENYASTDEPFQTTAAPQIGDLMVREMTVVRNGEKSVDDAIATIMEEGQAFLDEAASG